MKALLDTNVARLVAISAYRKLREQKLTWGHLEIIKDEMDWGPAPFERLPNFLRRNVKFIPAIATAGKINFFTYDLLEKEAWIVRPALDWARRNIWGLFNCSHLDFPCNTDGVLIDSADSGFFARYLNSIPARINDPKLARLIAEMGNDNTRDCVHVWLADLHTIDVFVTLDKAFAGRFNQTRKRLGYSPLATSPEDLGRRLSIPPISDSWFAERADPHIFYHDPTGLSIGDFCFTNDDAAKLFLRNT